MESKIKKFVPNEADNLHCFQACFKMVYEYFKGGELSMSSAEDMTNFVAGRPTWPFKGMLKLANEGLFVKVIEDFPNRQFVENPEKVIREHLNDASIAEKIISLSDLRQEIVYAKQCLDHRNIIFEEKIPTLEEIAGFVREGSLAIVNVNYWALLGVDKYYGHSVILEDVTEDSVKLQNPGLPPVQDQVVSRDTFVRAWQYPNKKLSNVILVSDTPFLFRS